MNTSFRKIQCIVAGVALALAGAPARCVCRRWRRAANNLW